jgi:hypothetical protein
MKLTSSELKTFKGFLRGARELMEDAGDLARPFDKKQAARIKGICRNIEDEIADVDRKLAEAERFEEGGTGK